MSKKVVITGGAGFIGSNFLRFMINKYPSYKFVNIDKFKPQTNLLRKQGKP